MNAAAITRLTRSRAPLIWMGIPRFVHSVDSPEGRWPRRHPAARVPLHAGEWVRARVCLFWVSLSDILAFSCRRCSFVQWRLTCLCPYWRVFVLLSRVCMFVRLCIRFTLRACSSTWEFVCVFMTAFISLSRNCPCALACVRVRVRVYACSCARFVPSCVFLCVSVRACPRSCSCLFVCAFCPLVCVSAR